MAADKNQMRAQQKKTQRWGKTIERISEIISNESMLFDLCDKIKINLS